VLTDSLVSYRSVALSNEAIFYRPVLLSGTSCSNGAKEPYLGVSRVCLQNQYIERLPDLGGS
jgi:hypothetical protein